ncbi:MAG TPA: efflux RND transporter periplasmic adaptor subunit [Anaeromyxobacteraceae bacterium]|nr:efflux RND transporter periplasmic adaptor subunit [Anaeromyxobacteraceae bacterium]
MSDPTRTSPPEEPQAPMPEGSEAAPPGVRAMAIVRWALVGAMAVAAVAAWVYFARTADEQVHGSEARYVCPMHPSIVSDHPGSCPICGMDLVPAGNAAARDGGAASAVAPPGRYWCPMHPEVHSDDPNAVCPKCGGMKLVPREPSASGTATRGRPPGLVAVDLSPERVQLIGVKTDLVGEQEISPTLRTVGMVTADEGSISIVSSRFSGWVEELLVSQTGERVRKGQVLARVYSPDLSTAQVNYLNAIRWARDQAAQSGQAASTLESDARARLTLLGISDLDIEELERRKKPLDAVSIRAPRDGYVGKRTAQVGLYVTPGQELFEIADLGTVWVIADVYESEIERVRVGEKASMSLQAMPGESFPGRVSFVYPAVNPTSRTIQVRLEFKNPQTRLRPGMFADVTLDLGAVAGLVVPADALVDTGESQYVFVALAGGHFEPRPVRVGARTADRVQILGGVKAGERVVTSANFLIDSESRLRAAIQGFGAGNEPDAARRER